MTSPLDTMTTAHPSPHSPPRPSPRPSQRVSPRFSAGSAAGRSLLAVLVALVMVVATACGGGQEESGPEQPTFEFIIPAGSGDRIEQGEVLDILPRELRTQVGETIQIRNEDDRAHILGPWFVGAGETLRQRFVTVGVFEGACSVHPSGAFTVYVDPSNA